MAVLKRKRKKMDPKLNTYLEIHLNTYADLTHSTLVLELREKQPLRFLRVQSNLKFSVVLLTSIMTQIYIGKDGSW